MDQGVKYVLSLEDLLTPKVRNAEQGVMGLEGAIDSLNSNVMGLASSLGLAFSVREIYEFGKSIVTTTADIEQSMLRIKFASKDMADGIKNQAFIVDEIDKFKIPILEAEAAYGKFLSMVGSSGYASERLRTLHDDLLTVGKVKGITDGQMNTAVMDLGKMLEANSVDARHLRGFGYQLNGIMPYIAAELHTTTAKLAQSIHHGKAVNIPTESILTAIHKQAADLAKYLPEATASIQSDLNDIGNDWIKFKSELGEDNKSEIKEFFAELKSGIGFLRDHKEELITTGKFVGELIKLYLQYKVVMIAVSALQSAWNLAIGIQLGQQAAAITETQSQIAAIIELTAALEALSVANAQAAETTSILVDAQGAALMNTGLAAQIQATTAAAASRSALAAGGAGATAGGAAAGAVAGKAILAVAVMYIADSVVGALLGESRVGNVWDDLHRMMFIMFKSDEKQLALGDKIIADVQKLFNVFDYSKGHNMNIAPYSMQYAVTHPYLLGANVGGKGGGASAADGAHNNNAGKADSNADKITGQRVITYNIKIDKMTGIGEVHTTNVHENISSAAHQISRALQSVVNDSQIKDNE